MGGIGCMPAACPRERVRRRPRAEAVDPAGPSASRPARFGVDSTRSTIIFNGDCGDRADDSAERLAALGIRVVTGQARFRDRAPSRSATTSRSRPGASSSPPAPCRHTGYSRPPHAIPDHRHGLPVARPAQATDRDWCGAHRSRTRPVVPATGFQVTVLEAGRPLADEDPEAVRIVLEALAREGVAVRAGVRILRIRRIRSRIEVALPGTAMARRKRSRGRIS